MNKTEIILVSIASAVLLAVTISTITNIKHKKRIKLIEKGQKKIVEDQTYQQSTFGTALDNIGSMVAEMTKEDKKDSEKQK